MKDKALKDVLNVNEVGIIGMYLVMFTGLNVACPNFLKFSNIMIGIRQAVYITIVAFAMTFVTSLGGINLSVGSTVGISGMVLATMILGGYNIHLAIGMIILLGTFIDLVNGLLVTKLRIAYFIATLGTTGILRGPTYVCTKRIPPYGLKYPEIQLVGRGYIGVVPFPIILTLIILLVCYYLFYKTKFGRYTVSIGNNEDAAKLVGIDVDKIKILVFMLSGVLCAVVGVILTPRNETAVPKADNVYEMDAIAATVIGGTSMSGERGDMVGTAFKAILMAAIKNDLSLLNVNTSWHQVVIGIFILFTVTLDGYASDRATKNG